MDMEKPSGMGETIVWKKDVKERLDAEQAAAEDTRKKETPKKKLRKHWASLSEHCLKELEKIEGEDAEYSTEDIMNAIYTNLASSNPSLSFSGTETEKEIYNLLKDFVDKEIKIYLSNKKTT